jgi:hypothetical protein
MGMLTKTDVYEHLSEEGESSARADLLKRRHGDDPAVLRHREIPRSLTSFDEGEGTRSLLADGDFRAGSQNG